MLLQPVNKDQVQKTAQVVLAYLEDARNATPNDMLDGVVSGKSLLRALVNGNLIVCQQVEVEKAEQPPIVITPKTEHCNLPESDTLCEDAA